MVPNLNLTQTSPFVLLLPQNFQLIQIDKTTHEMLHTLELNLFNLKFRWIVQISDSFDF